MAAARSGHDAAQIPCREPGWQRTAGDQAGKLRVVESDAHANAPAASGDVIGRHAAAGAQMGVAAELHGISQNPDGPAGRAACVVGCVVLARIIGAEQAIDDRVRGLDPDEPATPGHGLFVKAGRRSGQVRGRGRAIRIAIRDAAVGAHAPPGTAVAATGAIIPAPPRCKGVIGLALVRPGHRAGGRAAGVLRPVETARLGVETAAFVEFDRAQVKDHARAGDRIAVGIDGRPVADVHRPRDGHPRAAVEKGDSGVRRTGVDRQHPAGIQRQIAADRQHAARGLPETADRDLAGHRHIAGHRQGERAGKPGIQRRLAGDAGRRAPDGQRAAGQLQRRDGGGLREGDPSVGDDDLIGRGRHAFRDPVCGNLPVAAVGTREGSLRRENGRGAQRNPQHRTQ